jgi:hypothetical protein
MTLPLDTVLLVPEKTDGERDLVINTWQRLGGKVQRLERFWEKPAGLEGRKVAIYGNDTFAQVVAQVFGVQLLSPDDSLISHLSVAWTKRAIVIRTLADLTQANFPQFIKPVVPKQFKAKVYQSLSELAAETEGLSRQSQVLVSQVVEIMAEARGFILGDKLMDVALYEGNADIEAGKVFLTDFIKSQPDMPPCYVVDSGYNPKQGWFIVEFNACWGAGLNGCNAEKVIVCILEATHNSLIT